MRLAAVTAPAASHGASYACGMGKLRAAFLVLAVVTLAACSSGSTSTANVAACKTAMTKNYEYGLAHPSAAPATRPAACKGIPDATLQKLAAEIMASG